jgi:hypothetical protein
MTMTSIRILEYFFSVETANMTTTRVMPVHPSNHQYNHNQGHHDCDDPDDQVMKHNKVEALTFKGQLDLWIFDRWCHMYAASWRTSS